MNESTLCRTELLSSGLCVFVGGEPEPCRNTVWQHAACLCVSTEARLSGRLAARRHWASVSDRGNYPLSSPCSHTHLNRSCLGWALWHKVCSVCVFGNCFTLFSTGFTVCFSASFSLLKLERGFVFTTFARKISQHLLQNNLTEIRRTDKPRDQFQTFDGYHFSTKTIMLHTCAGGKR